MRRLRIERQRPAGRDAFCISYFAFSIRNPQSEIRNSSAIRNPQSAIPDASGSPYRFAIEFAILTIIAVSVVRMFIAETYLVPSGSMATTLLGHHKDALCPACGISVPVGWEEDGRFPETVACPNCLYPHIDLENVPLTGGDRLLVQKELFGYRDPRRWEPIVFQHPQHSRQAWVKRVAGLPGENIEIKAGDIYINGRIARKTWEEFLACRVGVYDSHFVPADPNMPLPRRFDGVGELNHWTVEYGKLLHRNGLDLIKYSGSIDRIEYVHRDHGAMENSIRDESPYNADRPNWDLDLVTDLVVTAQIEFGEIRGSTQGIFRLGLRIAANLELTLDIDHQSETISMKTTKATSQAKLAGLSKSEVLQVEFGLVDQTVWVRLDNRTVLPPMELDGRIERRFEPKTTSTRPIYFETSVSKATVSHVRIDRDIHYGGRITGSIHAAGIGKPYKLGADEFFMLGDNSPISNDSRAWPQPAVHRRLLIGKPILAHEPPIPNVLNLFGRNFRLPGFPFRNLRVVR